MKNMMDLIRSRNARLNLARRQADMMFNLLNPVVRPKTEDEWNALFASIRDAANDIVQGVHEASAYHNSLKDQKPL